MEIVYLVSYLIIKYEKPKFNYMLFHDEPALMDTLCSIIEHENDENLNPDDIVILSINPIYNDLDEGNEEQNIENECDCEHCDEIDCKNRKNKILN